MKGGDGPNTVLKDDENKPLLADSPVDALTNSDGSKTHFQPASSLSSGWKLALGVVIVIVIAVTWVGSTQTAKNTYSGGFEAPLFLVWFGTAWMVVVFPITAPLFFILGPGRLSLAGFRDLWSHSIKVFSPTKVTPKSILTSTVLFTGIWTVAKYMYARALISIAPTDVTALFSSAPAFVFLFSICILREPPLVFRAISVAMAIGGIVLFAYVEGFHSTTLIGVALSVGAAMGAATYRVLLKWRVGDASLYQMALFVSSIGLFSSLTVWPILLILHFTGAEVLADFPWAYLCATSALSVLFNFSVTFGIAYTFPLFISLGTILGIPVNAVVDTVFRGVDFLNWKFVAADLIVGGFLLMLLPPSDSVYVQRKVAGVFVKRK